MGALVTLELPADSPVLDLPWIITFGPLNEEDEEQGWEPVVCGPYERPHALALAESVVADEDLMAVVEPLLPHVSPDQIRGEIAAARLASGAEADITEPGEAVPGEAEYDEAEYGPAHDTDLAHGEYNGRAHIEPGAPPSVDEIRAGFARIAARLTSSASA